MEKEVEAGREGGRVSGNGVKRRKEVKDEGKEKEEEKEVGREKEMRRRRIMVR